MENFSKVCLTTYVFGTKYQKYIPLLLYSCYKAYPEYDVVLFLYEKLDPEIKSQIESLKLTNRVVIHESHFSDCPAMSPLKSKVLRWVLWDDIFKEYDYLYTIDIDMLYIREPIPLHDQHVRHMEYIGLPISNLQRKLTYNPFSYSALKLRITNAGFKAIGRFMSSSKATRLSGLHFVDIKNYYSVLDEDKRARFTKDIYSGAYLSYTLFPNNEVFLATMLKEVGFDISKMGIQSNPIDMLDYSLPERLEFRPHHGIHLGIFRSSLTDIPNNSKVILDSPTYMFYVNEFVKGIKYDNKFITLARRFPEDISMYIDRFFRYYKI